MSLLLIILITAITPFSSYAAAADYEDHWAAGYISEAMEREWAVGYPDGSFRPNSEITRAEFSTMLWKTLNLPITENANPFQDVDSAAWYYEAVLGLYQAGAVSGYGNGVFAPNVC